MRTPIKMTIAAWLLTGAVALAGAPAVDRVGLTRLADEPVPGQASCILGRELLRQATLIAARRELGLQVADEVLGEPATGPGVVTLRPDIRFADPPRPTSYGLTKDGGRQLMLLTLDGDTWMNWPQDAFPIAEKLSRTALVNALKKAGFTGTADKVDPAGAVDPAAAKALDRLELLSQLAAVRALDRQVAADGESPRRLAALARGYANAWQLSYYLWGAEGKDLAARALLYGQRAVVKFPGDDDALDGRGYAEALVGLPKLALADFDAAKAKRAATGGATTGWAELAADLARYDAGELVRVAGAEPRRAAWAGFFGFLTVEHMPGNAAPIQMAQLALKSRPDCVRLISAINDRSGPGLANWSSEAGFTAFSQTLSTADALPGLPADAAKAVAAFRASGLGVPQRLAAVAALHTAGDADDAEPSWHAVARTAEDATFVTAAQRVYHVAHGWGQDPADLVASVKPLLGKHRYWPFLAALADYKRDPAAFDTALDAVRIDDPSYSMRKFMPLWKPLSAGKTVMTENAFAETNDGTTSDMEAMAQPMLAGTSANRMDGDLGKLVVDRLTPVAPDSPVLHAAQIASDWPAAEPHVKQWLDDTGDHPTITLAVAEHYRRAKDPAKAMAYYERYLALSPDPAVYRTMAGMYRDAGDDAKWLATVDRCLEGESPGLENPRLAWETAQYLMQHGRPQDALKYAKQAAASGSAWGMEGLAAVDERLGDFDGAEKLAIQSGQAYDHPTTWAEFCVRTGHGDKDKAIAHAVAGTANVTDASGREPQSLRVNVELFEGDTAAAEKHAAAMLDRFGDQWAGLIVWTIALDRHDAAASSAALQRAAHPTKQFLWPDGVPRFTLARCARELAEADAGHAKAFVPTLPGPGEEDHDEPNVCYFGGRYCESVNDPDGAARLYYRAMASTEAKVARSLAAVRLRAMGKDPFDPPKP